MVLQICSWPLFRIEPHLRVRFVSKFCVTEGWDLPFGVKSGVDFSNGELRENGGYGFSLFGGSV